MTTRELTKDGPVWTVAINRPERRNAVDPATAIALREARGAVRGRPGRGGTLA
jgi:enoyl-CoA hydratase